MLKSNRKRRMEMFQFKRILAVFVCALLVISVFSGCKTSNKTSTKALVTIKFLEPGDKPKGYDLVTQKLNDKLKADGTGIQIERDYIAWDAWTQKTNLMLQTNESFDLLPIMEDITPMSTYQANGELTDITSAIKTEGTYITKYVPASILKAAEVNSKIYTIPAYWRDGSSFEGFDIRTDILKQYNLSMPTTPDEILQDMQLVQSKWTGSKKVYLDVQSSFNPLNNKETDLNRTYDTYPFTVKDSFFYIDQSGNVKSWFETPEFKQNCEFMNKAYKMGLINPDILTQTSDQYNNIFNTGNWFITFDSPMGPVSGLKENNPNATPDDVQNFVLDPDKPHLLSVPFMNSVAVPADSAHPNEAVKFINWLYSSEANYDLYYYGIEGTDYTKDGAHGLVEILDPKNSNLVDYADSDWMSGNMIYERYDNKNGFPNVNKALFTQSSNEISSIANGFTFDTSKVQTQYANIQTEAAQVLTPLCMGVQDYNTSYASAIAKMKAAGLDQVVAEYQSQFKAFLAKNK